MPPLHEASSSKPKPLPKRNYYVDERGTDMTHLTNATFREDYYLLSLIPVSTGTGMGDARPVNFTLPLCLLQSARFRDALLFHLPLEGGAPFHIDYYAHAAVCDKKPKVRRGCARVCAFAGAWWASASIHKLSP